VPVRGGSIEALSSFLNLSDRNDFVLRHRLAADRVAPWQPLPTAGRIRGNSLSGTLFGNPAPVRTAPREERDLFIAANNIVTQDPKWPHHGSGRARYTRPSQHTFAQQSAQLFSELRLLRICWVSHLGAGDFCSATGGRAEWK
jgi:hypothetical protein